MQKIKEEITQKLGHILKELGLQDVEVELVHPTNQGFGDLSTNIALKAVSGSGFTDPMALAKEIVKHYTKKQNTLMSLGIEKVEIAPPGFINFWLSKNFLITQLEEALKNDRLGFSSRLKNKRVMVEFTDPNPFKEFHIGHLYSNIVGESLSRLLESQGADVWRVCYQGDVGLHVAKAIWRMLRKFKVQSSKFKVEETEREIDKLEKKSLEERVGFLGEAYAQGSKAYEEDEKAKEEINLLNKKIYNQDPDILPLYNKGKQWSLDYFDKIYKRLGTSFKRLYFESEAGKVGISYVENGLAKGIFEKSDGAIIFSGKQYGLHTRVFVNSLGLPTYEAKELGLAHSKYKDFPYDESIIVTGNEINEYFKVLLKALSLLSPQLASKTKHISHGMVRLPSGKMSSRTGSVISGEWLLDEVKFQIAKEFKDIPSETAEKVAVGAVKYALLKSGIGKDVEFNFKESIALEGNSGPYLQYTYARTRSVVRKSQISNLKSQINTKYKILNTKYDLEDEEFALLRTLYRFPEIVEEASKKFTPNILYGYLYDLASQFNLFYQKHPILKGENVDFRIGLTEAVSKILKNGLHLLGIEAPEHM